MTLLTVRVVFVRAVDHVVVVYTSLADTGIPSLVVFVVRPIIVGKAAIAIAESSSLAVVGHVFGGPLVAAGLFLDLTLFGQAEPARPVGEVAVLVVDVVQVLGGLVLRHGRHLVRGR